MRTARRRTNKATFPVPLTLFPAERTSPPSFLPIRMLSLLRIVWARGAAPGREGRNSSGLQQREALRARPCGQGGCRRAASEGSVTIGPSFIEGLDIHRKKSECSPPPKRVPRMRLRSPRHPRCDRWWDLSRTSLDWDSKRTPRVRGIATKEPWLAGRWKPSQPVFVLSGLRCSPSATTVRSRSESTCM